MKTFRSLVLGLLALFPAALLAQTVTLTATPPSGVGPVNVTLTWSTAGFPAGATVSCMASGGWAGTKAASGTETVANVTSTQTYTLTCSGGTQTAQLSWTPPTQNENGTPLTNLASYKILHATTSAGLETATPIVIPAPASSYTLTGLPVGLRYFAVKATNSAGVDSVLSNVATKTVAAVSATASASVTVTPRPNPPTNVTVAVVEGLNMAPVYSITKLGKLSTLMGFIDTGSPCTGTPLLTYRGFDFHEVDRADVKWWGSTKLRVAAPCALASGSMQVS